MRGRGGEGRGREKERQRNEGRLYFRWPDDAERRERGRRGGTSRRTQRVKERRGRAGQGRARQGRAGCGGDETRRKRNVLETRIMASNAVSDS